VERSVQGRHRCKTSDALHGWSGTDRNRKALALAALWNKEMGLSHERRGTGSAGN